MRAACYKHNLCYAHGLILKCVFTLLRDHKEMSAERGDPRHPRCRVATVGIPFHSVFRA